MSKLRVCRGGELVAYFDRGWVDIPNNEQDWAAVESIVKLYTSTHGKHLLAVCRGESDFPEPSQALKSNDQKEPVLVELEGVLVVELEARVLRLLAQ